MGNPCYRQDAVLKPSGGVTAETFYLAQPQLPRLLNEGDNLDHAGEVKWDLLCKSRTRSLMSALSPHHGAEENNARDKYACVRFEHSCGQFTDVIPMPNIT